MKNRVLSFALSIIMLMGMICFRLPSSVAAADFTISTECLDMIKTFEGFSSKPYWDYGQWTIGYGTRVDPANLDRYQKEGISEEEATQLLLDFLQTYGDEVNQFINRYNLKADQAKFDALLSLSFNCGTNWLYQTSTLRSAIIEGKTGNDVIFALGQWSTAGGSVNKQLVKRRMIEVNMYLNGIYSMEAPSNYCYVLYDANGGERDVKVQCYDAELTDRSRSTPTYEGYTFDGWYTAATGGEKVQTLDASLHGKTLYAHWTVSDGTEPTDPEDSENQIKPADVTVTVAGDSVNIRSGPGTDYDRVGFVTAGEELHITAVAPGSGYLWGQFSDGWIALEFTNYYSVVKPSEPEPEPTQPETEPTEPETEPTEPETEPTEPETDSVTVTVTENNVHVRSGPGTDYNILGQIHAGTVIQITVTQSGSGYLWGKFTDGWICLDYTDYEPPTPEVETVTVTVTGDFVHIRSGPGTEYSILGQIHSGSVIEILQTQSGSGYLWGEFADGWICLDYTDYDEVINSAPPQEPVEVMLATVSGDLYLSVRSGPGFGNPEVGQLMQGKTVAVMEVCETEGTIWGRVRDGWIDLKDATLSLYQSDPSDTVGEEVTVAADVLNVRETPQTQAPVTGILLAGETVTVLETVTVDGIQWARIRQGWISLEDVRN